MKDGLSTDCARDGSTIQLFPLCQFQSLHSVEWTSVKWVTMGFSVLTAELQQYQQNIDYLSRAKLFNLTIMCYLQVLNESNWYSRPLTSLVS